MESLRNTFVNELIILAEHKKNIVALDCDMAKHNRLNLFSEKYPDRFYQVGISEQNAIGIAAGLGKMDRIPIVSSFATFICGRAWEQIRHSVVYNETNVKIFATHTGLSAGEDGGSHQCIEDIALMMSLPRIEVFSPAFPSECRAICKYIVESKICAYIRVGRDEVNYDINSKFEIGSPIVFGNKLADISIISTGEISQEVYRIIEMNRKVKMIHIGCLRPMNIEKVKQELQNVRKVIIVEEHVKYGGLASILYVNGLLNRKDVVLLNMGESFGQTGTLKELRKAYGLSTADILKYI